MPGYYGSDSHSLGMSLSLRCQVLRTLRGHDDAVRCVEAVIWMHKDLWLAYISCQIPTILVQYIVYYILIYYIHSTADVRALTL